MKKLLALFLVFICVLSTASADIDQLIEEYNLHTVNTSAQKLTGTHEQTERDGKIDYTFSVTDKIKVAITYSEGIPRVFSVICFDESESAEFLAQSANCVCQIGGYSSLLYCYADILDLFLQARAGNETENRKIVSEGLVYCLSKETFGYVFLIAK